MKKTEFDKALNKVNRLVAEMEADMRDRDGYLTEDGLYALMDIRNSLKKHDWSIVRATDHVQWNHSCDEDTARAKVVWAVRNLKKG